MQVPEIGLGAWKYRGGVEPLRHGIALGACLLDTAEIYGTEDVVGQAIKGMRERIVLATKVSGAHLRYDDVMRAASSSLRRLDTEYIDLYQIHWPNTQVPITETMRAMEALVDEDRPSTSGSVTSRSGTPRRTGGHAPLPHRVKPGAVQSQSAGHRARLAAYCQEHHITIIAYTPLDDGRLADPLRYDNGQGEKRSPRLPPKCTRPRRRWR